MPEELANRITHGLGMALAAIGLIVLVVLASLDGDVWKVVSCTVYGATLVALFTTSTLYHSVRRPRLRHALRILDHSAIYLLIAGTYMPFALVNLRGGWGWSLFGITWGLALCGILFKLRWVGRFEAVSIVMFLLMGWVAVVAAKPIVTALPLGCVLWLLAGGLAYTVGVVFYILGKRLTYSHAVWHVFVLMGSVCHYLSVVLYVLPHQV